MLLQLNYQDFTHYMLPEHVEIEYDINTRGEYYKCVTIELRADDDVFTMVQNLIVQQNPMPVEYNGNYIGADISGLCVVYIRARHNGIHKLFIDHRG